MFGTAQERRSQVQGTRRRFQNCLLCIVIFFFLESYAVVVPPPILAVIQKSCSFVYEDLVAIFFNLEVNNLAAMDLEFLITRNRNRTHPATWSTGVQALRSFLRDETVAFRQMLGFVVRWVVHTLDDLLQHRVFLSMVRFCVHRCST